MAAQVMSAQAHAYQAGFTPNGRYHSTQHSFHPGSSLKPCVKNLRPDLSLRRTTTMQTW